MTQYECYQCRLVFGDESYIYMKLGRLVCGKCKRESYKSQEVKNE